MHCGLESYVVSIPVGPALELYFVDNSKSVWDLTEILCRSCRKLEWKDFKNSLCPYRSGRAFTMPDGNRVTASNSM